MVKKGWLDRQIEQAQKDIDKWPEWMKREAELHNKAEGAKPPLAQRGSSAKVKRKN